jgi:hypothetical protein
MLCALANPHYLLELASSGLLDPVVPGPGEDASADASSGEPPFVAFVRYLAYWERPEFAKYIMYVPCLVLMGVEGAWGLVSRWPGVPMQRTIRVGLCRRAT